VEMLHPCLLLLSDQNWPSCSKSVVKLYAVSINVFQCRVLPNKCILLLPLFLSNDLLLTRSLFALVLKDGICKPYFGATRHSARHELIGESNQIRKNLIQRASKFFSRNAGHWKITGSEGNSNLWETWSRI